MKAKETKLPFYEYPFKFLTAFLKNPNEAFRKTVNIVYRRKLQSLFDANQKTITIKELVSSNVDTPNSLRVLIVIHLFYKDMADEFASLLKNTEISFTLLITTPHNNQEIEQKFEILPNCEKLEVLQTENIGRDIYPFFRSLESQDLSSYDMICKLHSKKSPHLKNGKHWRQDLLQSLLDPANIRKIHKEYRENPNLGLIGPKAHLHKKAGCRHNAYWVYKLLTRLGYSYNDLPFFGGTMFWVSTKSVPLMIGFEKEFIKYSKPDRYRVDGLIEHGLERCLPAMVINQGFSVSII